MPIGGLGGGAGNPAGSGGAFTGTAQALEYVGDHCYAYSGVVTSAGTSAPDSTMLSFTTGNHYIVAKINWATNSVGSDLMFLNVTLNDTIIFKGKWDNQPAMNDDQPIRIVVPAYTEVFVGWDANTSGKDCTVQLTGEVYRQPR